MNYPPLPALLLTGSLLCWTPFFLRLRYMQSHPVWLTSAVGYARPNAADLRLIQELETRTPLADGFYPCNELPEGVNLRQPAKHGLDRVDKFYTRRNLAAMSHIWKAIHRVESPEVAGHLAFVFTSL